jgi:hypothetical protein
MEKATDRKRQRERNSQDGNQIAALSPWSGNKKSLGKIYVPSFTPKARSS